MSERRIVIPSLKLSKSEPLWMRSCSVSRNGTPARKSAGSSKAPVQQFGTFSVPVTLPEPSPCEHAGIVVVTRPPSASAHAAYARNDDRRFTRRSLAEVGRRSLVPGAPDRSSTEDAVAVVEDRHLTAAHRAN